MSAIVVTKWHVPDGGMALILRGKPEETVAEASQYFNGSLPNLQGKEDTMDENKFLDLPDFEG